MVTTHPVSTDLLRQYLLTLNNKAVGTADAYSRVLRQFTTWLVQRPGNGGQFQPVHLTQTAVETYLVSLAAEGYSASHQTLVKAAISNFAHWLMEDQGLLRRNPTRGIQIASQPLLAPRVLNADQRYVLRNLVERSQDIRGAAVFALGYWAGCRVSDVSWLKRADTHVGPRSGWLTVGDKGGKQRKIDLLAKASSALYEYLVSEEGQTYRRWLPLPGLEYVQVVKQRVKRRLIQVKQRLVSGDLGQITAKLAAHGWGINTAFIERFNLTLRQHVPALGRRVLAYAQTEMGLSHQLALVYLYYNFCLPHAALRQLGQGRRPQERTPAMAVGLTDRV